MNNILAALNKLAFVLAPVFYKLLFMALTATCIGLVVLFIRKVTDKKISPLYKMAFWLLMIVALVLPYRPQSEAAILPAAPMEVSYRQAYDDARYEAFIGIQDESLSTEQVAELTEKRDELYLQSLAVDVVLPLLWFGGMIVYGGFLAASAISFNSKLKTANPVYGRSAYILEQCKDQLQINKSIELLRYDEINSPAVTGLFKPKILLPAYGEELSDRELRYILLHELSHWKRGDLLKNAGLLVLQTIYWFDPLIAWLFKFMREDMELLNDASVLRHLEQEEEKAYSLALVSILARSNGLPMAPRLLCMCDEGKNMERRISSIQRRSFFKKKRPVIIIATCVILLCLALLFLTEPVSKGTVDNKLHFAATEQSPGFVLSLTTSDQWTIKNEETDSYHSRLPIGDMHFSAKYIYDDSHDEAIAWIFAQNFTPYEEMTFHDENYYQTVFPELRLKSIGVWDPFTSVKVGDTSEVGICSTYFHDTDFIAANPTVSMAGVPTLESKGILAYDVGLGVYVGIGFSADFEISDEEVRTIAESLEINASVDESIDLSQLQMSYDNVVDPVIAQGLLDNIHLDIHGDHAAVGWTIFGSDRMNGYESLYAHVLYRTFNISDGEIEIVNGSSHYAEITIDLSLSSGPVFYSYRELPKAFDPKQVNPDFELTTEHTDAELAQIQAYMDTLLEVGRQQAAVPVAQRFRTPLGDVPDFSNTLIAYTNGDILAISSNEDKELLELKEDNWAYVICNGYAYMEEAKGFFGTDKTDMQQSFTTELKKLQVGDTIGELTLVDAHTAFFNEYAGNDPPYFEGCSARFEGTVSMRGKCRIIPEDGDFLSKGEILFIPDENSCKIPLMSSIFLPDASPLRDSVLSSFSDGVSTYYSEYPREILLGNVSDYPQLDFSSFPSDGTYADVEVTVNNVLVRSELNLMAGTSANLLSCEVH